MYVGGLAGAEKQNTTIISLTAVVFKRALLQFFSTKENHLSLMFNLRTALGGWKQLDQKKKTHPCKGDTHTHKENAQRVRKPLCCLSKVDWVRAVCP